MKRTLSFILSIVMALTVTAGLDISIFAEECLHEHTEVRDAVEATYTDDGYTGDVWCTDCETKIEEGETIPRLQRIGWQKIDGVWYLYDDSENLLYGWQQVDDVWYYLDPSTGEMQTGWIQLGDNWYYLRKSGAMATGWVKLDGYWYYLDPTSGVMKTGWFEEEGFTYYFRPSGTMVTGARNIDDNLYFFDKHGHRATGWQEINNKWYYFANATGIAYKGRWISVKGNWFYLNEKGAMLTGWQKINGNWFYLNKYGVMQKGWTKVKDNWFYMNKHGVMQTGWIKLSGKWYYLNKYGVMQTGWTKINGKYYYFDSKGVWRKGFNNVYEFYSSNYVNNYNRTQNLKIASAAIDGTILEPGEVFDFNAIVGPRTAGKGYLPAPVFTGTTTHEDQIGGGICQVSSTIFNAALYANLEIVERHQHSQRVYYVPFGRDAAMYSTVNNFRFRNNTRYPIKVGMEVSGGVITCTLYTEEYVKPANVTLNVTQSGNTFTLRRYANGVCNYVTTSTY